MRATYRYSTLDKSLWTCLHDAIFFCLIMDANVCAAPTNSTLTTLFVGETLEPSMSESLSMLAESSTDSQTQQLTNSEGKYSSDAVMHSKNIVNTDKLQTLESGIVTYSKANTNFPNETSALYFTGSYSSTTQRDSAENKDSQDTSYRKCSDVLSSWHAAETAKGGQQLHTSIAPTRAGCYSEYSTNIGTRGCILNDLAQTLTSESFSFTMSVGVVLPLSSSTRGFDEYQSLSDASQTSRYTIPTSNVQVHSDTISSKAAAISSTSYGESYFFTKDPVSTFETECSDCHYVHISSSSFVQSTRSVYFPTVSSKRMDVKSTTREMDIRPSTLVYLKLSGSPLLCETTESHTETFTDTLVSFTDTLVPSQVSDAVIPASGAARPGEVAGDTGESTSSSIKESTVISLSDKTTPSEASTESGKFSVTTSDSGLTSGTDPETSATDAGGDNIDTTSHSSSSNGEDTTSNTRSKTTTTDQPNAAQESQSKTEGASSGSQSSSSTVPSSVKSVTVPEGGDSGVGSTGSSVTESLPGSTGSSGGTDTTVTGSQALSTTTNTPTSAQRLPQSVLIGLVFGLIFCVALIIMCVCFWKFCCNGPGITPHLYTYKAQTLRVAPVSPPPTHRPKLIFVAD